MNEEEPGQTLIQGALTGAHGLCRIAACAKPPTHWTHYKGDMITPAGRIAYCLPCALERKSYFPKLFSEPVALDPYEETEEWA